MKIQDIKTPAYVIDEKKLKYNLQILKDVEDRSGCKILLAQKAFSCYYEYPLIGKFISGTTASGLYEARLGKEEMGKENHVFSPAYKDDEIDEIASICDHVIFNSFSQLNKYGNKVNDIHEGKKGIGLRINPGCSTQDAAIYDPCAKGSRLGVTKDAFDAGIKKYADAFELVDGLHFHTLCEQNFDALDVTFKAFEKEFSDVLMSPGIKWLNMGGGHHITRDDYDVDGLVELIKYIKDKYNVEVYLEPGEAIALNAGYLVTSVLDIVHNDDSILILDASAACHAPDILEMPYRAPLKNSGKEGEKKYTYTLSSCTCLAGDVFGKYSFDREINIGDRLYFEDMAIYSMVKNNTFNGMALPSIYAMDDDDSCKKIKSFGYDEFKRRL